MRVHVVGAGVVGTATGKGFLYQGHDVGFVDTDLSRVEALRDAGLTADRELDLSDGASIVFMAVPTPCVGTRYDLSAVIGATRSIGRAIAQARDFHIVVVRSTTPPGTVDNLIQPLVEQLVGSACGERFSVATNPEFLRAECAEQDFQQRWATVIGARSKRTRELLADMYRPFGGELSLFDDPMSAELAGCIHNVFNATKISFWNEMWRTAQALGVDFSPVAATVAASAEGSWNPAYGLRGGQPYGGEGLPKDARGFLGFAADAGIDLPLVEATIKVNELMGEPPAEPEMFFDLTVLPALA